MHFFIVNYDDFNFVMHSYFPANGLKCLAEEQNAQEKRCCYLIWKQTLIIFSLVMISAIKTELGFVLVTTFFNPKNVSVSCWCSLDYNTRVYFIQIDIIPNLGSCG